MLIKRFRAKNFYSFKTVELEFSDYSGIVRVTGKNQDSGGSNGSGKSSIFEAICWGIYGKTIRSSNEESLVNNQTGKDCQVCIELFKENLGDVKITRTKRPTSLNLEVNGSNRNKENVSETQKYIEELLETDYKSFLASIVFGQHSEVSFLDSSPEDKRNIIRNCFNLEEVFSNRNSVKELKSEYTGQLKSLTLMLDSLKKERDKIQVPDKKYKYVDLPSLEDILKAEREIQALKSNSKDLQEAIRKSSERASKIKQQMDQGEFCDTKECPVCKAPYTKTQTGDDLIKLNFDFGVARSAVTFDSEQLTKLQDKIKALTPAISSSDWAKYNEKNKLVLDSQKILDKLTEIESKIKESEKSIKDLEESIEVMKFWELAFSEKGVIRYIIRNILDYLNLKSNEYLSILTNNQFSIEFNDELTETIKNNGSVTRYVSLSGGECRRVNLAIMLALQDLSAKISRTNCNLIFFDEVCDNLDNLGIEAVNNLLHTLRIQYPEKVILLITHNQKLSELLHETQEIKVVKSKGISSLV